MESVKAASDVYAPISGTVVEVNEALEDQPDLVNEDAEGKGWLAKLEVSWQRGAVCRMLRVGACSFALGRRARLLCTLSHAGG